MAAGRCEGHAQPAGVDQGGGPQAAAYSDAHVHSVILQAVILPCLERIVHSIGIELLSIFFLGVFAIALRRRCMAGAGSNMLRVHAYVKLLAVTTWIIAIWPFLSSWSGSFILWFNIGFEIPRPTLTSTLYYSWWSRAHSMGCAVGGRWCLRWRIQLCWSSSRESVLCLCSVGRSCSGGRHI